ncbi:ATP-binding protein [Kitasatospora sp. NPDC048194]|uniref:ATP-binding protein n=1 Tax=Kitasatospora sp. NPDC048194 TaxID=3364045 RepID=UPI003721A9AD
MLVDNSSGARSGQWSVRHVFDGRHGSIGAARAVTRDFLAALHRARPSDDPRAADNILLAVSELVTNAVRHTAGPGRLHIDFSEDGRVRVTVSDTSTAVPEPRQPQPDGTGGYGWPLLEKLADALTVVPHESGKHIHAALPWPGRAPGFPG